MSKNFDALNTWTLVAFKQDMGPVMKLAPCHNKAGEAFKCLAFSKARDAEYTFVYFSKKLNVPEGGQAFKDWLIENASQLKVAENLSATGNTCYTLYKEGGSWEDLTGCI